MWKNESWLLPKFNISSGTSSSDVTYRWWRCERRRTHSRWTSAACTSSRRPSRPAGAAWTAHRTLWPWQQQAGMAPSSNFHLMPSTCAAFKAPSDISLTSGVCRNAAKRNTRIARNCCKTLKRSVMTLILAGRSFPFSLWRYVRIVIAGISFEQWKHQDLHPWRVGVSDGAQPTKINMRWIIKTQNCRSS